MQVWPRFDPVLTWLWPRSDPKRNGTWMLTQWMGHSGSTLIKYLVHAILPQFGPAGTSLFQIWQFIPFLLESNVGWTWVRPIYVHSLVCMHVILACMCISWFHVHGMKYTYTSWHVCTILASMRVMDTNLSQKKCSKFFFLGSKTFFYHGYPHNWTFIFQMWQANGQKPKIFRA